jgi:hypothetical protein
LSFASQSLQFLIFFILIFYFFDFGGLHPVASVTMIYLGVPSIATMFLIVFIFLFSFYTPLHDSALMGQRQAGIYTVTYGS